VPEESSGSKVVVHLGGKRRVGKRGSTKRWVGRARRKFYPRLIASKNEAGQILEETLQGAHSGEAYAWSAKS